MKTTVTPLLQGELSKPSRIVLAFLALAMLPALVLPVWHMRLNAPQYPDGLDVTIYSHTVGGDLREINGLNHYIGMDPIEPDEFPEFRFIPFFILRLVLFAGLAALVARIPIAAIGWIDLVLFGSVMMFDFQSWLTRFGTNLAPEAAITLEPFAPKFIGTTTIAQFSVESYPAAATVMMMIAGVAGPIILFYEWYRRRA